MTVHFSPARAVGSRTSDTVASAGVSAELPAAAVLNDSISSALIALAAIGAGSLFRRRRGGLVLLAGVAFLAGGSLLYLRPQALAHALPVWVPFALSGLAFICVGAYFIAEFRRSARQCFALASLRTNFVPPPKLGATHLWLADGGLAGLQKPGVPPVEMVKAKHFPGLLLKEPEEGPNGSALYHVIEGKSYVSWVDAQYWVLLRRLKELTGMTVRVAVSSKEPRSEQERAAQRLFERYVQRFVGPNVEFDDNVLRVIQVHVANQPVPPPTGSPAAASQPATTSDSAETRKLVAPEPPTGTTSKSGVGLVEGEELEPLARMSEYSSLPGYLKLGPLFLAGKAPIALIWEGYYAHVAEVEKRIGGSLMSSDGQRTIRLELPESSHVSYLVHPTAVDINGNPLKPETSLLLTDPNVDALARHLALLPRDSITFILTCLLAPHCSWADRVRLWGARVRHLRHSREQTAVDGVTAVDGAAAEAIARVVSPILQRIGLEMREG